MSTVTRNAGCSSCAAVFGRPAKIISKSKPIAQKPFLGIIEPLTFPRNNENVRACNFESLNFRTLIFESLSVESLNMKFPRRSRRRGKQCDFALPEFFSGLAHGSQQSIPVFKVGRENLFHHESRQLGSHKIQHDGGVV